MLNKAYKLDLINSVKKSKSDCKKLTRLEELYLGTLLNGLRIQITADTI